MWKLWVQTPAIYMWDRQFFVSEKGYIGLVPETASMKDVVFLLMGCTHPVILRPVADYNIAIGEAYFDGLIYGEALNLREKGDLDSQEFKLR
jgi:hypothetical protein